MQSDLYSLQQGVFQQNLALENSNKHKGMCQTHQRSKLKRFTAVCAVLLGGLVMQFHKIREMALAEVYQSVLHQFRTSKTTIPAEISVFVFPSRLWISCKLTMTRVA